MSTWRRKFTRKSEKLNETEGNSVSNVGKYRKKLQAAITQIHRTKKTTQRNLESSDSEIHVARLINDIGQLSDSKSLQEISSFIDSLAMRHQLSSRIFNEYAMNALQQSLQKLNDNLSSDFDQTKSVYDEATANHCSDPTKKQLLKKVQIEWSKHQTLAMKELKNGLSSYCDVGLYNLKIQMLMLEKLQSFVDQLPQDNDDTNTGLPDFSTNSLQARRDIDTMLRIMLDNAPNDPASLPNGTRPKFLNNQLPLSNTLYSAEITEAAAARSQGQSLRQQNAHCLRPYPRNLLYGSSNMADGVQTNDHESMMISPMTPHVDRFPSAPEDDRLPSYTDLFVVPATCKGEHLPRRSSRQNPK